MKLQILILFVSMVFTFSQCTKSTETSETTPVAEAKVVGGWQVFGTEINPDNALPLTQVVDSFTEEEEQEFKISGTIEKVCQAKGCWTTIKTDDGRSVRVTFENYSFFLPKDAAGKKIVAEGLGFKSVTSVEELRHFAEDEGVSEEEILAINEPKVEYLFEARGVLLQ